MVLELESNRKRRLDRKNIMLKGPATPFLITLVGLVLLCVQYNTSQEVSIGKLTIDYNIGSTSSSLTSSSDRRSNIKCFDGQWTEGKRMAQLLCSDNNNNDNSIIIDNGNNNTIDPKKEKKNDTRPALAVCIQGKTRTFVSPLAQESLRINLASAFGARHTAFYFHLAPVDRRGGWAMDQENKKLRHATPQESLNAVANVLGVSVTEDLTLQKEPHPLLGGMVVSSAASDNHHHHNHPNNTINIDATNVHVYRLKKETNTDGGDPTIICDNDGVEILIDERDDDEIFDYNLRNYNTTGNCKKQIHEFAKHGKSRRPYVASSVAQWSAFEECHEFVTRQEEKQGYKFDYVLRARPDLVYTSPIRPHCFYSSKTVFTSSDWAFFMPRHVLDGMHEAYTGMMNCHPKYVSRNEIVEMHLFRILKTYLEEEGGELQAGLWQPQNEQPFHPQYIGGAMMLRPPQESTKMHFQSYCTKSSTTIPNGDYQQKDNLCTKIVQYNKYNVPEIDESQFNSSPTTL